MNIVMHTDDEDYTEAMTLLRELGPVLGEDVVDELVASKRVRSRLSRMLDEDASAGVRKLGEAMENRPEDLDPIADQAGYFLKILSRFKRDGEEGEVEEGDVVGALRELLSGTNAGDDILEQILAHDDLRAELRKLSRADGMDAVEKLGTGIENRSDDLDPIADPGSYFLEILSRYEKKGAAGKRRRKQGEVVGALREQLSGTDAGEDMLEQILAHEELRATLRMLSRADGMDAVEKLGASLENDLDPIDDPGGYFLEMLSPYEKKEGGGNGRRNGRKGNRNKANAATSDANDDEADLPLEDQLRLAERRVGSFRSNWSRAEEKVVELEAKVEELTSELDRMKTELQRLE